MTNKKYLSFTIVLLFTLNVRSQAIINTENLMKSMDSTLTVGVGINGDFKFAILCSLDGNGITENFTKFDCATDVIFLITVSKNLLSIDNRVTFHSFILLRRYKLSS